MTEDELRRAEVLDALRAWGSDLEWEELEDLSEIVTRMDEQRPRLHNADIDRIVEGVVSELAGQIEYVEPGDRIDGGGAWRTWRLASRRALSSRSSVSS